MKNIFLISGLSAAIVAGGLSQAVAEGEGKRGLHHGPRHSFEQLDADADQRITKAEMAAHQAQRFEQADTDGNGSLSADELTARMKARMAERGGEFAARMIERHDADGDGEISLAEMRPRHADRFFERADTDGDGAISAAEFAEMKSRHAERRKKHRHKADGED